MQGLCTGFESEALLLSVHELGTGGGYAEALIELVSRESQPVAVVAWSMGAIVALEAAARSPELFTALALLSATPRFTSSREWRYGIAPARVRAMISGMYDRSADTLQGFFTNGPPPSESVEQNISQALDFGVTSLVEGLQYLQHVDLRNKLLNIKTPVLLLHGLRDQIVPYGAGVYLKENIREARLITLPEEGHRLPQFLKREDIIQVGSFLRDAL